MPETDKKKIQMWYVVLTYSHMFRQVPFMDPMAPRMAKTGVLTIRSAKGLNLQPNSLV